MLLYRPAPKVRPRLEAILARVREMRANFYPPDWTYDPLYEIEQKLAALLKDISR